MEVTHHATGQELLAHAAVFLEEAEAENGVILGLAGANSAVGAGALWLSVGLPVAMVGVRTPPFNLALSRGSSVAAVEALVRDLRGVVDLPGVTAPADTALAFAELWANATNKRHRITMRQGIYELRRVIPIAPSRRARGRLRAATPADVPLIVEWMGNFASDASLPASEMRVYQERAIKMVAEGGTLFVWESPDGAALVSMAFLQGKTKHGVRVSMVYTPTEHRGHGYATTFVADLSAHVLASGRAFCMLYADLANPTSNAIYQRVGYELVCESITVEFSA